MEATLCLRSPDQSTQKLHSLLTLHGRNPTLLRHHHLSLPFSPLSNSILWTMRTQRLQPVMCCPLPLQKDGKKGKGEATGSHSKLRGPRTMATVATVVLACALGAMWPKWKGRANAWPLSFSPQASSDHNAIPHPSSERNQMQKSMDVLLEIYQGKTIRGGVQKPATSLPTLVELLREQVADRRLDKDYLSRLKVSEKGDPAMISLYNEWDNKKPCPETYELGLLLIDILINQGEYQRADHVCKKIEIIAPEMDVRPRIRRVIINAMLLTYGTGMEVRENDEIKELRKMMDTTVLKLIEFVRIHYGHPLTPSNDGFPPSFPPSVPY